MKYLFALMALVCMPVFAFDYGPLNAPVNLSIYETDSFSDTETFVINFDPTQWVVGPTSITVKGMTQAGNCGGRGCIFYRQTEISSVTLTDTATGVQALDVNGNPIVMVDNPVVGYRQHTYDVWTAWTQLPDGSVTSGAQLANGTYQLQWSGASCNSRTPPCSTGSAYLFSDVAVQLTAVPPPPPPVCTGECGDAKINSNRK